MSVTTKSPLTYRDLLAVMYATAPHFSPAEQYLLALAHNLIDDLDWLDRHISDPAELAKTIVDVDLDAVMDSFPQSTPEGTEE